MKYHEMLSKVPFIDTIITTNYDELFERAYGDERIHKVVQSLDLPFINNAKTVLYKLHGELANPASIIVSEGDFRSFYSKKDLLLWKVIEGMMATKTLVFLGYSLDDPNILSMFEYVLGSLPSVMKEAYLIAPNLNTIKVKELAMKNVVYINSTGEDFVEDLIKYFKDNLLLDASNGVVSGDKARAMLKNLGLNFIGSLNKEGVSIDGLYKQDGTYNYELNFTMKGDSVYTDQLRKLDRGEILGAISIPYSDFLHIEFRAEGFRLPVNTEFLYIEKAAAFDKLVDLLFDDGVSYSDLHIKLYGALGKIKIVVRYKHVVMEFTVGKIRKGVSDVNFAITHDDKKFKSVSAEKEIYSLLSKFASGESFKLFDVDGEVYSNKIESRELVKYADGMIRYFNDLNAIERHFSVVFKNMDVESNYYSEVEMLANIINNSVLQIKFEVPYKVDKDENNASLVRDNIRGGKGDLVVTAKCKYNMSFEIYGKEFGVEFAKTYLIMDGYIKEGEKGNSKVYVVGSKSKKAQLNYEYPATDNPPFNISV
ncbi:hypothetical protein B0919_07510 [Hymenobacter sp. CRA2]|nr:hypothetical protein B0919_07510 [Hymenobacter sp. CRA2]